MAKALLAAATILSAQHSLLASDANTPDIKGLAHICIYTKNIDESVKFYTETLGFKLIHRTELQSGFKFAIVRQGTCIIELLEPKDVARSTQRLTGVIDHIALVVDDINKAVEQLKAKNVSFKTGIMDDPNLFGGVRIAFFRGPSGETFELFEYLHPVPGLYEMPAAKN
jgi:catechol 2,3-dioxygenase-like lactoylglutathione lyase family enzyme